MKSAKDIEQSLRRAELDVKVNGKADRVVLDELTEVQRAASRTGRRTASWSAALKLAAILAIVAGTALLVSRHEGPGPGPSETGEQIVSRLELATAMSLERAFRQGGLEAVEDQYRRVFGDTGRKVEAPSVEDLLTDVEAEMNDHRSEKL